MERTLASSVRDQRPSGSLSPDTDPTASKRRRRGDESPGDLHKRKAEEEKIQVTFRY